MIFDTHIPLMIAGPTAIGKSAWAMELAQQHNGEIICADSRQVYQGFVIGTGSPTQQELQAIPHHGYNVVSPKEAYDAGRFIHDTDTYVDDVLSRGKWPICVGGNGLYLRCWRFGLNDVPHKDPTISAALVEQKNAEGLSVLYARLQEVDPLSASTIHANDEVRIMRALEIFESSGQPASSLRKSHFFAEPRREARFFRFDADKAWIDARINARVADMFANGLIDETEQLIHRLGSAHPLLATMGYAEASQVIRGELTREAAIAATSKRHRDYAKRQRTWFKKETWWEVMPPISR